MATYTELGRRSKDQIANHVYDWHEIIPVPEMENVTPEFFQINITYLTRMFLSLNEFSLIIFLHEKKFNLSQRN